MIWEVLRFVVSSSGRVALLYLYNPSYIFRVPQSSLLWKKLDISDRKSDSISKMSCVKGLEGFGFRILVFVRLGNPEERLFATVGTWLRQKK